MHRLAVPYRQRTSTTQLPKEFGGKPRRRLKQKKKTAIRHRLLTRRKPVTGYMDKRTSVQKNKKKVSSCHLPQTFLIVIYNTFNLSNLWEVYPSYLHQKLAVNTSKPELLILKNSILPQINQSPGSHWLLQHYRIHPAKPLHPTPQTRTKLPWRIYPNLYRTGIRRDLRVPCGTRPGQMNRRG